jgi:hypothetical protein
VNMSNSPDNFDNLQKLLKLKRHEQPPPGYFNHFSSKVLNRIEREEEKDLDTAWIRKLLTMLETNPIAAGLFGISVCSLLISGIAYSQYQPASSGANGSDIGMNLAEADSGASGVNWSKATRSDSVSPSVNPMFSTNVPGSLFNGMEPVMAVPVKYPVGE